MAALEVMRMGIAVFVGMPSVAVGQVGARFAVAINGAKPNNGARRSMLERVTDTMNGYARCVGCGVFIAMEGGRIIDGWLIAVAECDRIINDHPAWMVIDADGRPARADYALATVHAVCPTCNGSNGRDRVLDALAVASWHAMVRHAVRIG